MGTQYNTMQCVAGPNDWSDLNYNARGGAVIERRNARLPRRLLGYFDGAVGRHDYDTTPRGAKDFIIVKQDYNNRKQIRDLAVWERERL